MNDECSFDDFLNFIHNLNHPTYEMDGRLYQWPLCRMEQFCHYLGDPQDQLKIIHVAGTNGKGSCVSILSSYLRFCGYKVGIYISPEVIDVRERIQINGEYVDSTYVSDFYCKIQAYIQCQEKKHLKAFDTYSQVLVALAFSYFKDMHVDFAIIETGIGGLNDPTNIVTPILSVITSIGFDHMSLLGYDLMSIARAKSGIIKKNIPVVVGCIDSSIKDVFLNAAQEKQSPIYYVNKYLVADSRTDNVQGATPYQDDNVACCWLSINVLSKYKYDVPVCREKLMMATTSYKTLNNLRGRWEKIYSKPDIYLDICDNELGAESVFRHVNRLMCERSYSRLVIIIGLTGPSKLGVVKYLPRNAIYYYTQSRSFISAEEVKDAIGVSGECFLLPSDAIEKYLKESHPNDLVLVVGSIHVVRDAIIFFERNDVDSLICRNKDDCNR